jgi:tetratricopeptide (TPR) repeat protein
MPPDIQDAQVQRVLESARQKVVDQPYSAAAWGHLGKVLLAHLFADEADFCFAEAARLAPTEPLWFYGRGVIALKREPDKAVPFLRQAVAAGGSQPESRSAMSLQLAEALQERGELDEAERLFREEQQSAPKSPRAAFGLGLIAKARGNEPLATKFLTVAQRSSSARKKATAQLAALARVRGDRETADACEQQAAGLPDDPPWPDPLLDEVVRLQVGRRGLERRVGILEQQHRYAEAAELYLRQIEEGPTAQAYAGAGINLARLRDYERAMPLLREGIRLDPGSAHARYALALALFARAERESKESPGAPQIKEWFQEALEHARQTTQRRPDHAGAYLVWGLALKHLGDPGAAVEPLAKGVACSPADLELQLGLGEVLLEVGRFKEAEVHLENARRLAPNDPRPANALKRARQKTNQ